MLGLGPPLCGVVVGEMSRRRRPAREPSPGMGRSGVGISGPWLSRPGGVFEFGPSRGVHGVAKDPGVSHEDRVLGAQVGAALAAGRRDGLYNELVAASQGTDPVAIYAMVHAWARQVRRLRIENSYGVDAVVEFAGARRHRRCHRPGLALPASRKQASKGGQPTTANRSRVRGEYRARPAKAVG